MDEDGSNLAGWEWIHTLLQVVRQSVEWFYVEGILCRQKIIEKPRPAEFVPSMLICNYTNTINRFNHSGHTVHFNNSFVRHIQYIDASTFCLTIEL